MSQDLREMFKDVDLEQRHSMKDGHEQRFLKKMEKELPISKRPFLFTYKIAASLVLLICTGLYFMINSRVQEPVPTGVVDKEATVSEGEGISLGDLSPDLKKVEDYYMANINLELAHLEISDRNKALIDSFMERLEELNLEYKKLNTELNEIGPNDQTITALIKNLQLRLQLLLKLKDKLKELHMESNGTDQNKPINSIT